MPDPHPNVPESPPAPIAVGLGTKLGLGGIAAVAVPLLIDLLTDERIDTPTRIALIVAGAILGVAVIYSRGKQAEAIEYSRGRELPPAPEAERMTGALMEWKNSGGSAIVGVTPQYGVAGNPGAPAVGTFVNPEPDLDAANEDVLVGVPEVLDNDLLDEEGPVDADELDTIPPDEVDSPGTNGAAAGFDLDDTRGEDDEELDR